MNDKDDNIHAGTMAALLKEKPKRGRPRRAVARQNVYVALSQKQKKLMKQMAAQLPKGLVRADIPDLAITTLAVRMEALRRAVADRHREIPEGITDLESLYLLWDLPLPLPDETRWTSLRVSPQEAIELGRVQGTLHVIFGVTRSETFSLALALLQQLLEDYPLAKQTMTLDEMRQKITSIYL